MVACRSELRLINQILPPIRKPVDVRSADCFDIKIVLFNQIVKSVSCLPTSDLHLWF